MGQQKRLSEEQVRKAIESSGLPFEVELFHKLTDAQMNPIHRWPMKVQGTEKPVEVDLIAGTERRFDVGGKITEVGVHLFVEAKAFRRNEVVGFVSADWAEPEKLTSRFRVAGLPSWNVVEDGGTVPPWAADAVSSVRPLIETEWCAQWAVVKETNGAGAPDDTGKYWPELVKLATASDAWACDVTNDFAKLPDRNPPGSLHLYVPVFVVDTPHLYVFDARTGALRKVPWFALRLMMNVRGHMRSTVFDVVCSSGFDHLLSRYKQAADQLEDATKAQIDAVRMQAAGERIDNSAMVVSGESRWSNSPRRGF